MATSVQPARQIPSPLGACIRQTWVGQQRPDCLALPQGESMQNVGLLLPTIRLPGQTRRMNWVFPNPDLPGSWAAAAAHLWPFWPHPWHQEEARIGTSRSQLAWCIQAKCYSWWFLTCNWMFGCSTHSLSWFVGARGQHPQDPYSISSFLPWAAGKSKEHCINIWHAFVYMN